MFTKVSGLVFCNHIVQGVGEEGKKSVVLVIDGIGKAALLIGLEMVVIDIEGRELIDAHAVDLGNIVLVRCDGTGSRRTR